MVETFFLALLEDFGLACPITGNFLLNLGFFLFDLSLSIRIDVNGVALVELSHLHTQRLFRLGPRVNCGLEDLAVSGGAADLAIRSVVQLRVRLPLTVGGR